MHKCESPEGTVFNYNSDFSGKVRVKYGAEEMWIPGEDILWFVAYHHVMSNRIRRVEQMNWRELLS
jgi:hypothetical protein